MRRFIASLLFGGATMLSLALGTLISQAPAQAPKASAFDGEYEKLQGTWIVARREENGATVDELPKRVTAIIEGNRLTVRAPGRIHYIGTFDIVAIGDKGFRHLNLRITDGENEGTFWHAIYVVDGNTFHYCFTDTPGAPRPRAFATDPVAGTTYVNWERMKQ